MNVKVNITTDSGSDVDQVSRAVATRLKAYRKAKKMSLDELSRRASISKGMLVEMEKEAANPSIAILCKLAAALGVSVADIVNVASEPALHIIPAEQIPTLWQGPLGGSARLLAGTIALAKENNVVLFEAFKTASLPNFLLLKETLAKVGKLRKAFINYCQYSSRYQRYLDGENPNTFNPAFSNGSIMDIGFYCLASAVALWGEPQAVLATASLLDSGVDAQGTVVLSYGDFDVTLHHSKVSDSAIPSEIQGEDGALVIEKISECQKLAFVPRGGKAQDLTQPQHINTILYEAETFARLVETQDVDHPGLAVSRITAKLSSEIRRQTGVIFPADTQPLA